MQAMKDANSCLTPYSAYLDTRDPVPLRACKAQPFMPECRGGCGWQLVLPQRLHMGLVAAPPACSSSPSLVDWGNATGIPRALLSGEARKGTARAHSPPRPLRHRISPRRTLCNMIVTRARPPPPLRHAEHHWFYSQDAAC